MDSRKSIVLPAVVKDNITPKVLKTLGDKKLMPRAARKRLGSSLSGPALHQYIEAMKKEGVEEQPAEATEKQ